jgi:NAD(P)-dependent dehydrogenase (short-subunit alcohol dehydrogenase family)
MAKTLLVCGFGPGISTAVADKFGAQGFSIGLVARTKDRLDAGVKALAAKGVKAAAFPADLGDPKAVARVVGEVSASLGPLTAIHWNAYGGLAGDLLTADAAALRGVFDLSVVSLVATVQAAHADLKKADGAAILVTNGGLGLLDPQMDAMGVGWNAMGLSIANAAKDKLVGLLAEKLKNDRIYVGQVMVMGAVKGTAFDSGQATLDPVKIAGQFWSLYTERKELRTRFG